MPNKINIHSYIVDKKSVRAEDLRIAFNLSRVSIHKILKKLILEGKIQKDGYPPKVFYTPADDVENITQDIKVEDKIKGYIDKNYLYISPDGQILDGFDGFTVWCNKTKQEVSKTALNYYQRIKFYDKFKKDGLINGTEKLKKTFEKVGLNKLYYLDFYSIDRFGKTKLGQMLLYAKQSQNIELIKKISNIAKPTINDLIKRLNITSIGYIPPTVKREVQFMKEIEKYLNLPLNKLTITKIKKRVSIPQKTLSKLEDRIENAKKTIVVEGNNTFDNVLLIDDAVGSGSTLNETALQIKDKKICKGKIYGLAIVGSFKGFDVISEV